MMRWGLAILILAPPPSAGAEVADRAAYLADVSTLLKKTWPQNRTVHVVCHGHSVPAGYFYGLNDRRLGLEKARAAWTAMIAKAKAAGARVILLTPTGDTSAKLDDPGDPINRHAEQIRGLAAEHRVGLADNLAAFKRYVSGGGRLEDLKSQINHPNRKGHDLVAEALLAWFPR